MSREQGFHVVPLQPFYAGAQAVQQLGANPLVASNLSTGDGLDVGQYTIDHGNYILNGFFENVEFGRSGKGLVALNSR